MLIEERILTLFRRNCQYTLTYWSVFFSFGLSIAFLGPTILDLKCQTGSTLQEITWVFFSQQLCLLIGSSTGGVFTKTALIALFFSSLIISVVFAIIPLCYNVLLLAVAMAVSGLAMGIIDTIANIQLVSIYKKDSAIFLQALHFFIGLGALVSPLIADPFISEHCLASNSTANATEIIHHFRSSFRSPVIHTENSPHSEPVEEKANVAYAFWIMALINAGVIVTLLLLLILYTNRVFLFVGTTLLGLFISSVFPCLVAYTEDILEYHGCATTVLVTTAGMGEMTLQVLVGSLIQKKGTYSFLVCGLVIGCLGFVFFLSVVLCNRIHRNLTGKNNITWL
uniref:Major facilitator superfamily domain-containing protein 4B-like n=1 Tax=Sinocyclocheilus rhinocerous TaxID=307959 RepID=A0A673HTX4_9TELE